MRFLEKYERNTIWQPKMIPGVGTQMFVSSLILQGIDELARL